jgi:hypothetical protein
MKKIIKKISKLYENFLFFKVDIWFLLLIIIFFWLFSLTSLNSKIFGKKISNFSKNVINFPVSIFAEVKKINQTNSFTELRNVLKKNKNLKNELFFIDDEPEVKKIKRTNSFTELSDVLKKNKNLKNELYFLDDKPKVAEYKLASEEFIVPLQIKNNIFFFYPKDDRKLKFNVPGVVKAYSAFDNTFIVKLNEEIEDSTTQIAKVNKEGKVLWKKKINAHHAIHVDEKGFIYTPINNKKYDGLLRKFESKAGFTYRDDGYAILNPDGSILVQESVSDILINNDLGHFIFGVGAFERDSIHLNAVKPSPFDTSGFKKGDLIFSLRHQSMIFMYNVESKKVLWHQVGPWINQHDPDFLENGNISIYGNDVISSKKNRTSPKADLIYGQNDIYIFDPIQRSVSKPYTNLIRRSGLATITGGAHKIYRDGRFAVHFSNIGILALFDPITDEIKYYYLENNDLIDNKSNMALFIH